jgi:hypothetical protein
MILPAISHAGGLLILGVLDIDINRTRHANQGTRDANKF